MNSRSNASTFSAPLVLAAAASLALTNLASVAAAQTGAFKDGELVVATTKYPSGAYGLNRVDPATGNGADFVNFNYYLPAFASAATYDSFRGRLIVNASMGTDPYWLGRLWSIASNGSSVSLPGFSGSTRGLTSTGDGRLYFMENSGAAPLQYYDANDVLHTVMDASGAAPFVFSVEHMLWHAPTNSLIASTSGWWSSNDCTSGQCSFFRIPLSLDGSQVAGPITCNSYASDSQEIMALDYLPGGQVLATLASGAPMGVWRMIALDPVTLAISPWANPWVNDINGGVWSSKLGTAILLDDAGNALRTVGAGLDGVPPVLPTTIAVGDVFSGYAPGETMWEIDVNGPGCIGFGDIYGAGLAGTGSVLPNLTLGGCPDLNEPITVVASQVVGAAPGLLAIASAPASIPLLGGTLLVSPSAAMLPVFAAGAAGVAGAGQFTLPFTATDPALLGASVYLQAGFLDANAVQGVSLTNGLQISFG